MEVWSVSSSGEMRQRGERTRGKKSPELEDLKQPPGHAGVEEVHLSGVDFLQQEQQSSTPPPLFLLFQIVLSHISPFWPFTPFTPHPSLSRGEEHLHM